MSTQVVFSLKHLFVPGSNERDNAIALECLMDCLISLNIAHLSYHRELPLYQSGIRYGRTKEWDPIPEMYARGYGDCKSLSAALIAEYRLRAISARPSFRFLPVKDRFGVLTDFKYHILVQTDGGFEDPSKDFGMGRDENKWF